MATGDAMERASRPERALTAAAQRLELDFGGLAIAYDERILVPREWTVAQSAWGAELLSKAPPGPVLELCSGAGHIGLLAVRDRPRDLVLVDASDVAADYARHNAEAAGMADRVTVVHGRLEEAVAERQVYALILADPPWVASRQVSRFPADPPFAIDGGEQGLDVVWACLSVIGLALRRDGDAVLQIGDESQVEAVREHLAARPDLELEVCAHRRYERGVLVHLRRPQGQDTQVYDAGTSGSDRP